MTLNNFIERYAEELFEDSLEHQEFLISNLSTYLYNKLIQCDEFKGTRCEYVEQPCFQIGQYGKESKNYAVDIFKINYNNNFTYYANNYLYSLIQTNRNIYSIRLKNTN